MLFAKNTHAKLVAVTFFTCGLITIPFFAYGESEKPATILNPKEEISSLRFSGVCDGSAAIRIDGETLLVANDENNTLYSFNIWGGKPVAKINLNNRLELESKKEMDIEAAVQDKDKIWWIGSHGRSKKGKKRPNRRVLFSTNVPDRDLLDVTIVDRPVDLTDVLLADQTVADILTKEVRKRAPKEGGVNIEGLSKHPDGGLLLGLRSPLSKPDGKAGLATLVRIVEEGGAFKVGNVYRIDLNNRGVRDIIQNGQNFLLIAGKVASGKKSSLYSWNPVSGDLQESDIKFKKFNPEALVRLNKHLLVLSDDGKRERLDEEAEDGIRKCGKIAEKNSHGASHKNVFFNAVILE